MPDMVSIASFQALLQDLAPCFTSPSFASFELLMIGWVLNLRRHTTTETVRAAGAESLRLVVVRRFPGPARDDVFVSTDPQPSAKTII
jgi:hypothetical protein